MKILNEFFKIFSAVFMNVFIGAVIYNGTETYDLITYAIVVAFAYADFRITKEVLEDTTALIARKVNELRVKKLSVKGA